MSTGAERPHRPTADQMLARLQGDERSGARAPADLPRHGAGVGKTFKMLEEGHRRHDRGTDAVVGFVETYGRRHTAALLDGLEAVPRRRIEYRGVVVEEMDADAIIARHPAVVLVDELAHTNVPGSPAGEAMAGRRADPGRRDRRHQHVQRAARRVRRGRRRDDPGRPRPRARARRRGPLGRRDRARGHEPARASPADAPRQRLPARPGRHRPRAVLHRAEPHRASRPQPALRRRPRGP